MYVGLRYKQLLGLTSSIALRHRLPVLRIGGTNIIGTRSNEPVVVELFDYVCRPAADAGDRKNRREQIDVNSQRVVGRRGIEVDVGVELFVCLDKLFDLVGNLEPLGLAAG